MSSAGMGGTSGTNDTERTDEMNGATPEMLDLDAEINEEGLGEIPAEQAAEEPVEVLEVVEFGTAESPQFFGEEVPSGFRWWYVPMAIAPTAAVVAGAVWYARRRQKQGAQEAAKTLSKQGRNLINQARMTMDKKAAAGTAQRSVNAAREALQNLPEQASTWRGKSAEALGGLASSDVVELTTEKMRDALDQLSELWEKNARPTLEQQAQNIAESGNDLRKRLALWLAGIAAQEALATARNKVVGGVSAATANAQKAATKRRMKATASDIIGRTREQARSVAKSDAAQSAREQAKRAMDRRSDLSEQVKAVAKSGAAVKATSAAKSASEQSRHAAKQARRKARSGWRQARAFTFAMLVTATITYVRTWRQRQRQVKTEKNTRETAGGRLVRDA